MDQLNIMEVFSVPQTISPLALAKMEKYNGKRARGKKEEIRNGNNWQI